MFKEPVDILLFLCQGFEDLAAVTVLDVFGRTQCREHIQKARIADECGDVKGKAPIMIAHEKRDSIFSGVKP